jgi:hypothetical protein
MKLLYLMKDPLGSGDNKLGITGFAHAAVRLGTYQNSYSARSHIATFDRVWYGDDNPVKELEKTLKNQFGYAIQFEGRGFSEWIAEDQTTILQKIDETIKGYHYHVYPACDYPVNIYNVKALIEDLTPK